MDNIKFIEKFEFKEIEENIFSFWEKNKIYSKIKEKNTGKQKFYFLDGPPYTSGSVHVGTSWNKIMKDAVLRYKRAQGFDVWDRAGYDMHGLPTSNKVMEELGMKHKEEIEKYGVDKFILKCREFSLKNLESMNKTFKRLGVWMDFDNAYKPINPEFIEGVWWLTKQAHNKGRLYEGEKTMTWCASCGTALAKHELEYKEVKDTSVFLKFKLKDKENEYFIIWTTTPWTIPFNLGIMVNPELEYVKIKVENEIWYVSKGLVGIFMNSVVGKPYEVLEEFKGDKLEGIHYEHIFENELHDVYENIRKKGADIHRVVLSSEYVDLSAGTGLVHMAPGCGPEDYEVGHKNKIPPFNNINEEGVFPEEMGKFKGWIAKKDDSKFIEEFENKGALVEKTEVEHDYAFCWRCHNPVIFRTTKQWFFKVEDLVEEFRRLNKEVHWVPGWAGQNQFDSWLSNLRDNSITRQRYWGTPVPIWKCEKCGNYEVIGTIDELKKKTGKTPLDLHKPWIDELTIKCEKCGNEMKRIPDIFDVWLDAGTNSWTCLDFPSNQKLIKRLYPADFIIEGKDQIRGWFNVLLICGMLGFNRHPYKNVYMHGYINDKQGRKMSKSEQNYILPEEVIDKFGVDAFRYYTQGGTNPGVDLNYNFEDITIKFRNLRILWNIHTYLLNYFEELKGEFNKDEFKLSNIKNTFSKEEKFMLSVVERTKKQVTKAYDEYRLHDVPSLLENLYMTLSKKYIHLIRDKTSSENVADKKAILFTLTYSLFEFLKMFHTIAPFITEQIYLNLKKGGIDEIIDMKYVSLSLYDWPKVEKELENEGLEEKFNIMLDKIIPSILFGREKIGLGVRWPIKELIIVGGDEKLKIIIDELGDLIKTRTNIKKIIFEDKISKYLIKQAKTDYNKIKERFGTSNAPKIIANMTINSAESILSHIEKEGSYKMEIDRKTFEITKEDFIIETENKIGYFKCGEVLSATLILNKERNQKLDAEGYARELMRAIQNIRKKMGLQKSDSVKIFIKTTENMTETLKEFKEMIASKVGAIELIFSIGNPTKNYSTKQETKIKNKIFDIFIDKMGQ